MLACASDLKLDVTIDNVEEAASLVIDAERFRWLVENNKFAKTVELPIANDDKVSQVPFVIPSIIERKSRLKRLAVPSSVELSRMALLRHSHREDLFWLKKALKTNFLKYKLIVSLNDLPEVVYEDMTSREKEFEYCIKDENDPSGKEFWIPVVQRDVPECKGFVR